MVPKLARARAGWPVLLLLVSVGAIALVAVQAYRAAASQQAVREQVLRDYARVVAWNYERHLMEVMRDAAREVLQPVNHYPGVHQFPPVPHADVLGDYLPWDPNCLCHRTRYGPIPDTLFSFVLGSDTVGVALNYYPEPDGGLRTDPMPADRSLPPPPAAAFGGQFRWVNDTITRQLRSGYRSETRFPYIVSFGAGQPRLLAYTVMPTSWGDTVLYAVMYNERVLRGMLAQVLDQRQLLPPTFQAASANRDVIALEVESFDERPIFRSYQGSEPAWSLSSGELAPDYGSLRIRSHIRPAYAETLTIGGLPRSQLPLLLGLLGLSVALALVAFTLLARENQLARARSDFVASVSHELRTPLAQVRLFVETLRLGRADTEEARQWSLDQIDRESRRLVHLVDNVLVFTRGPGRLLEEPAQPLELTGEVRAIVAEYEPLAASRRARIEVAAPDLPLVWVGSRNALRHALLNVLDNAVKYGPMDQVVRVHVTPSPGGARIEVHDQGPGVPPAERERIWQPFQRGGGRVARAVGGSGIGLHLVRELMHAQGGSARVTDSPDGGACFVLELRCPPVASP